MTKDRIAQLRKVTRDTDRMTPSVANIVWECLDEIERLKQVEKDAVKAIKLAMKGRK